VTIRAFLTGVVLVSALGSSVATEAAAAPSTVTHNCGHLIVDPRGNAYDFYLPTKPYNPEADLLSVDAVTTATTVVFTVRMASVNAHPTTGSSVGIYFALDHQGGTSNYLVNVSHQADADSYVVENQDTEQVTDVTGTTDPTKGTYVVSVPRADIGAKYRGAVLNGLGVIASRNFGVSLANAGFIEQSTGPEYHYRVGYGYGCRK